MNNLFAPPKKSTIAVSCALALSQLFISNYALADDVDHDWTSLSEQRDYHVQIENSNVDTETVLQHDSLSKAGEFGIIELYYHGAKGSVDVPSNSLSIKSANNSPIKINLDSNPTTGIYIARRNHNSYDNMDVPDPQLSIENSLSITGNINNQVMEKSGQAVAGITIANGSLRIAGDLSIDLQNMNSKTDADFSNVPEDIKVDANRPKWDILYGWSTLDQADRNSSPQPHNINLLQAGIASGFSQINVEKNVNIKVSGTNGLLTGWYWAPNDRSQYSGTEFDLIDARDPTTIKGDLNIQTSQTGPGYGAFGVLWDYTQKIGASSGLAPAMETEIDGMVDVHVTASGYTDLDIPENANILADYSKRIAGLYMNDHVNLSAKQGIKSSVQILDKSATKSVYGIFLWNFSTIDTPNLESDILISDDSSVDSVCGLSLANNKNDNPFVLSDISINIDGKAKNNEGIYLNATRLTVLNNLTVNAGAYSANSNRPTSLYVDSVSKDTDLIVNKEGKGRVNLVGDIQATANDPHIDITFGKGGHFTGAALVEIDETWGENPLTSSELNDLYSKYWLRVPEMTLRFDSNSEWELNGNSKVTNLILSDNSKVTLNLYDYSENLEQSDLGYGGSVLTLRNFKGSSVTQTPGVFRFELQGHGTSQKSSLVRIINEVDSENNYAEIQLSSNGDFSAEKTNYLIQDSSLDRNAEFALVDLPGLGRKAELGVHVYDLKYFDDVNGELAEKYNGEAGDRYWYAEKTEEIAPPIKDVVSMASYSTQIAHYLSRLSDLRQRLGNVRYYGEQGLWTTVITSGERITGLAGTAFDFETTGINLGWDHTLKNGWTFGVYGRYFKAEQDSTKDYHYTRGQSDNFGVSLYLSRSFTNGSYLDFVASYDKYDQELSGIMSDQITHFKTDYDTYGYGVSSELGFQYPITDDQKWVLEPNLQLSYYHVKGRDFTLSTGVSVNESSVDSLTGRAGINLVRELTSNGNRVGEFYSKIGLNYEFMGKQNITANDVEFKGDLLGLRIYYGLGVNLQIRPDLYGWIQIARENGDDYTKEYEGTAGIRWIF